MSGPLMLAIRFPLASLVALLFCGAIPAQVVSRADFRVNFSKGIELEDKKFQDKWMKRQHGTIHAALYFEELYNEQMGGDFDNSVKLEALKTSWQRCFEGNGTLHRVQRWLDSLDRKTYDSLQRGRGQSVKLWQMHLAMTDANREELLHTSGQYGQLARNAAALGHKLDVAELYSLAYTVADKIKKADMTLDDRREIVRLREEFINARDAWGFNFDGQYTGTKAFLKDEKIRIGVDEKKADKRRAEGYGGDSKGADNLVMPNVEEQKHTLKYKALTGWDKESDYGPKNGQFPPLWWTVVTGKSGTVGELTWFLRRKIYFARTGGNKFGITLDPNDLKKVMPIHVSSRAKPSTFYLDADKNVPYTMFFWVGSDKERIGLAENNLAPRSDFVLAYYRSGASWITTVGKERVVLYDDNCNGSAGEVNVWEKQFKVNTIGEHDSDGTPVPLLDSMRIGKGKRRPASEFVQLADGWFHMRRTKAEEIGLRPLNPKYFKIGKLKLSWKGPKKSAPSQLVVQGAGDYRTAFFDLAGGKEIEVPAGEYSVIFGRISLGKGSRVQNATLYQGDSESFKVEAGKVKVLKMGAPFRLTYTRRGDKKASIDALKIFVQESSGCVMTELHGMGLAPEVVAAKKDDGKGAKVVGKFVPFTDGELVNTAGKTHNRLSTLCALFPMPQGYKGGAMTLKVELKAEGMKLGLRQKKHPVFGRLVPHWQ